MRLKYILLCWKNITYTFSKYVILYIDFSFPSTSWKSKAYLRYSFTLESCVIVELGFACWIALKITQNIKNEMIRLLLMKYCLLEYYCVCVCVCDIHIVGYLSYKLLHLFSSFCLLALLDMRTWSIFFVHVVMLKFHG